MRIKKKKQRKMNLAICRWFNDKTNLPSINIVFVKNKNKVKILEEIKSIFETKTLKNFEIICLLDDNFSLLSDTPNSEETKKTIEKCLRVLRINDDEYQNRYIERLMSFGFYLGYHFNGKKFTFQ